MKKTYIFVIALIIALGCIVLMQPNVNAADSEGNFVVVLDPGHGAGDPGAANGGYGLIEANINYKISKYTQEELEKYEGVKVYLTRYGDCPSISERADIAKKYEADLLVSQHINSGSASASGAEVWVTQDKTQIEYYEKSKEVGNSILNKLSALGLYNHGVSTRSGQPDEWYESGVVKDYYGIIRYGMNYGIRSILVEHCYISNDSDCRNFLSTDEQIRRMAIADAQGIAEAYKLEKKGQGRASVKTMTFKKPTMTLLITPDTAEPLDTIKPIFTPSNAYNQEFDTYSSDPEVARVFGDRIRGLKEGEVTVTAISRNNQRIAKCRVVVKKEAVPVRSIDISQSEYTVNIDDAVDIPFTYTPSNASNAEFYWTSSDDSILRVFGNRFRALKAGTAYVIATTLDGTVETTLKVTVLDPNAIYVKELKPEREEYTVNVDEAVDISFTYTPTDSTNAEFYWTSSDDSILRVFGNRFRALKPGTAYVIATTLDGSYEKRIKVTVNGNNTTNYVTELIPEKQEYVANIDEAVDIPFKYTPSNASNAEFYWTSSDDSILRVFGNRFRALKPGTAYVIATTLDGRYQKKIKVTVNGNNTTNYVTEIIPEKEEYIATVDEAVDIPFKYTPSNASNAEFYWTSSDDSIIRVWGNRFRALKPGTAYVIAKTLDGRYEKRIKVIVQ